jgi:hypothetical protein
VSMFFIPEQFANNFHFQLSSVKASQKCQQGKTRPVSNYFVSRAPETLQKNVNFAAAPQQQRQTAIGNVKLDPNRMFSPDVVRIIKDHRAGKRFSSGHNQRAKLANTRIYRNSYYEEEEEEESDSDTETNIDSLYDNENFGIIESETMGESEFELETDVNVSIESLEEDLSRITSSYVHKVKSRVEESMSKMKINERPKVVKREIGGGDKKQQLESMNLLKKAQIEKKECYRKIDAILNRMKSLDNLTEELTKNFRNCQ